MASKSIFGIAAKDAKARVEALTEREREVAGMIAMGEKHDDIAKKLGLSPKTCDIHRGNVKKKLQAETHGIARIWFAAMA